VGNVREKKSEMKKGDSMRVREQKREQNGKNGD
jgi:hypothetical protein